MPKPEIKALEVIYNSVCPVCDAGVCSIQKKINPAHGAYIRLDINKAPDRLADYGVTMDDVRLKLHAIDRGGELRVGIDAFAAIFAETPRYKWIAFLIRLPLVHIISTQLYNLTAHLLYKWNKSKGRW